MRSRPICFYKRWGWTREQLWNAFFSPDLSICQTLLNKFLCLLLQTSRVVLTISSTSSQLTLPRSGLKGDNDKRHGLKFFDLSEVDSQVLARAENGGTIRGFECAKHDPDSAGERSSRNDINSARKLKKVQCTQKTLKVLRNLYTSTGY